MRAILISVTNPAPLRLLVPTVVVFAALCVPPRASVQEDRAQLVGTVRDSVTGAPSKGLEVLLEPAGGRDRYMTSADDDGAFSFTSVEPGDYRIALHRQGYQY